MIGFDQSALRPEDAQNSPVIHFTVKEFYAYLQAAWMPLPFRRDMGNAARQNNAPRQLSAALTGHLHQNTNGESHEKGPYPILDTWRGGVPLSPKEHYCFAFRGIIHGMSKIWRRKGRVSPIYESNCSE